MRHGAFAGKKVWLSGHTGFKGSWLAEWLLELGAEVAGFSLAPAEPGLFAQLGLAGRLRHETGDVRDEAAVARSLRRTAPDFAFHLAAQPIVRASYERPVETYAVNALGTVNVLEGLRRLEAPCAAVIVTSDKCYAEPPPGDGYAEDAALGGRDPYASSKAMAELAVDAYRRSYFLGGHPVRVASARGGNVVGGGDWGRDRLIPDCVRALRQGRPIALRRPGAIRPWQHVLDALHGYLSLAAALAGSAGGRPSAFESAFNFGPGPGGHRTVAELVGELLRHWPGTWEDRSEPGSPPEAECLTLRTEKARRVLGWTPVWDFSETVARTALWYRGASTPAEALALTHGQIGAFSDAAAGLALEGRPA